MQSKLKSKSGIMFPPTGIITMDPCNQMPMTYADPKQLLNNSCFLLQQLSTGLCVLSWPKVLDLWAKLWAQLPSSGDSAPSLSPFSFCASFLFPKLRADLWTRSKKCFGNRQLTYCWMTSKISSTTLSTTWKMRFNAKVISSVLRPVFHKLECVTGLNTNQCKGREITLRQRN